MMRTTILVTALLLSASAVYAQRVEPTLVEGHPVINCDGMSSSAYTITTKGNTEAVLKTEDANKAVYKRFAVHKRDNSTSSNWSNAFYLCSNIGRDWRLPTQRELQLMWVLKSALDKTDFTTFSTYYYWSATESNSNSSRSVYLGTGGTLNSDSKINGRWVRCVRELTP